MSELAVDLSALAGFRLDIGDIGTTFSTNSTRTLDGLTLPAGSSGLLATVTPVLTDFRTAFGGLCGQDRTTLDAYATALADNATRYQATDGSTGQTLARTGQQLAGSTGTTVEGSDGGVTRFTGLALSVATIENEPPYVIARTLTSVVETIGPYDDVLGSVIGMKPAADYLTPLIGDWEALQGIGIRIRSLGINDYVTAQNLINGTSWLQQFWTGDAARAFAHTTTQFAQAVDTRSLDLDIVAKIVENAGRALERRVYNLALSLAAAVVTPMTFHNLTLPLASWAGLVDKPIDESTRSEVIAAVDDLKRTAESGKNAVTTLIDHITRALNYRPGQAAPTYNSTDFDIPDKVTVDLGTHRYGFGGNTWWEDSIASAG
ncbi:hypothetical protein [Nocardia carnea]|uniref:hypothetical protein n=1 Tax=Nocardia carnea TaxID=37328 RepID=UPI002457B86B|nr:hypothetical protein [Nocardia carnea]